MGGGGGGGGGGGLSKAKIFKGKYEAKLKFPDVLGDQSKAPYVNVKKVLMDIFWNNAVLY